MASAPIDYDSPDPHRAEREDTSERTLATLVADPRSGVVDVDEAELNEAIGLFGPDLEPQRRSARMPRLRVINGELFGFGTDLSPASLLASHA